VVLADLSTPGGIKRKMEKTNPMRLITGRNLPSITFDRRKTALVVIDMQYLDAHPGFGMLKQAIDSGVQAKFQWYIDRLPLIQEKVKILQRAFREKGMEVIHVKIASLTKDGRDRSLEHKNSSMFAPPNSKEAEILDGLGPQGDEIEFAKTASGVFNSTNIDYVLKNLGIEQLVIGGVVTNGCVEIAVRDAADRSYRVVLVEDCCAAFTKELHEEAVGRLKEVYAKVFTTDEVVRMLSSL
jgi:nicotinamidase-related amidase